MPTALLSRKYMPDLGTSSYSCGTYGILCFEGCLCPWPAAISVYIHLSFNYFYFPLVQRVFGGPKIAVAAWLILLYISLE
jgi:hypothetical protein